MKLVRDILEQYLDGEVDAGQKGQIEQALRSDAAAGRLLARLRQERALRQAALRTYESSAAENAARVQATLLALAEHEHAPLAKIGGWRMVRWASAVAAGLVLVAGSFWAGRATVPTTVAMIEPIPGPVVDASALQVQVIVVDPLNGVTTHTFPTAQAANDFVREQQQNEAVASTVMF